MIFTLIFLYVGPVIILSALGFISIYLTYADFFPGRTHIGWTLFGITVAVYFTFMVLHAGTGEITVGTLFSFFYILFLTAFLSLQGPLLLELIALTVIPDPSKGLKLLKVHTEAERKVIDDDLPGAIEEYEKIIAEDPEDLAARFRLAELHSENEDYRKAVIVYEAILKQPKELSPDQYCSALTRLSEIYGNHLGDINQARKHIQTIIEKFPFTKYASYAEEHLSNL